MRFFSFFIISAALWAWAYFHTPDIPSFKISSDPIQSFSIYNPDLKVPMPPVKMVHSSTMAALKDPHEILLAYFGGSREGAKDCNIYANLIQQAHYSDAFILLDRQRLMRDSKEYIKKIGNPVLFYFNGTIHLFVVGASLGGWATSKIYHYTLTQNDTSTTKPFILHYQKEIPMSPFLNLSTLVRTRPLFISFENDPGFILPVYHEMAQKYALLTFFDSSGKLIGFFKPNSATGLLQPTITPLNQTEYMLAFRSHKKANDTLFTQICRNDFSCAPLKKSNLKNHDSSLNLVSYQKSLYLIYNPSTLAPREKLAIAKKEWGGGTNFMPLTTLAKATNQFGEASYPTSLVIGPQVIISYTQDRKSIRLLKIDLNKLSSTTHRKTND